jgi:hypothetical protein
MFVARLARVRGIASSSPAPARRACAAVAACLVWLALPGSGAAPAWAQSTAVNGTIEGTVSDSSGAVLPGVTVTVTGIDTGAQRVLVTNESGLYRAPLLPLGTYTVTAELEGFKKYEETAIRVGAGQTVTFNVTPGVGQLSETVVVSAESRPILDQGKIDAGRNLSSVEVKNLPLVARNPYNFALAQPGVTGFENPEFGVPRLSANGTLMRINYQIDGNTNTEKDRAGLRLLPMSEVMVSEVKVVTSGYAPEFGQTMGMVYNAITPSGTNTIRGDVSYLFRRKNFSAFPFFFQGPRTDARKPDTQVDTITATVGGPAIKDKLFYYVGYERTKRDLSAQKVITITPENAAAIGLPAQPGVPPNIQKVPFFIGKGDYQLNGSNRLTARYIRFRNDSPYNNGVGTTVNGAVGSMQIGADFIDAMDSTAAQLVSTLGTSRLNELRVQYAYRHQQSLANDDSGPAPCITVSGAATFGGPYCVTGQGGNGFDFRQNIWQVIDNFTYIRGSHSFKAGFDAQFVHDERTNAPQQTYTFGSIANYNLARSGANPFAYTTFSQLLGERSFDMDTKLYGVFAQDEWQLSPNLKLLYGVRYDLYQYPEGRADSPLDSSKSFNSDKNNFGPRVGIAWTMDDRSVVRASTGLMYDQPLLIAYENAIQYNGSPLSYSVSLGPTAVGAPAFPANLSSPPPGFVLPVQSIATVDPEFQTARTWQTNLQYERALGTDYAMTIGYAFSKIDDLPVVTDTNLINPVGTLSDGRPVYSTAVNASTRSDPRFNHVYTLQSLGSGTYNSLSFTLTRRFARGTTFNLGYTIAKGEDNAPLSQHFPGTSALGVESDEFRTDPTDLDRDKGPNKLDMRHNFNGSIVFNPSVDIGNAVARAVLNNNQLGILMQFNSGLPFNIIGNQDLNRDGFSGDRPVGVGRNSIYLPARYNVDLRYSRFVPIRGTMRAEIIGEFKNLFNTVQTSAVNRTIAVNTLGDATVPIPTSGEDFRATAGYEQRQFQLGFRFRF